MLLAIATIAAAHDGGFGHSRRTLFIAPHEEGLLVEYRITMAPEEALVELAGVDADGDGRTTPAERDAWFAERRAPQIAAGLVVRNEAGQPLVVRPLGYELGQGLTQTYRFVIATDDRDVFLEDKNFTHQPGIIQVRTAPGIMAELTEKTDLSHAERVPLKISREE